MTELMKVSFDGDLLEAIPQGDDLWVSVRRICDALGIDNASQQTKLKKKPWATIVNIPTVGQDNKIREVFCLHVDSVPMWLAGMETGRMKPEVRLKLERYQLQCAKVLKEAFIKPVKLPPHSSLDPLDFVVQQAQGMIALASEMKAQSARLGRVEVTLDKLMSNQEAAEQELLHVERASEKSTQRTTRSKIVELVRAYVYATNANYQMTWNKLYRELQYRYHFDARARAKHRRVSPLEVIEQEGQIETLFLIASEIFPISMPQPHSSYLFPNL